MDCIDLTYTFIDTYFFYVICDEQNYRASVLSDNIRGNFPFVLDLDFALDFSFFHRDDHMSGFGLTNDYIYLSRQLQRLQHNMSQTARQAVARSAYILTEHVSC